MVLLMRRGTAEGYRGGVIRIGQNVQLEVPEHPHSPMMAIYLLRLKTFGVGIGILLVV
jgi:hypothetical protein